jgi:competence protein ComEC
VEAFFLDVAQGTAQVILLGNRNAIVIDCGILDDLTVLHFLQRQGVNHIERLIISHSHSDHIGGSTSVLGEYQDQIGKICFVDDGHFRKSNFWRLIKDLFISGVIKEDQLARLECTDSPQLIWQDGALGACLETYSPNLPNNLIAQDADLPNSTSAVLFFKAGSNTIVFASDSVVQQWKGIYERSKQKKTACKILAVPHHAGAFHSSQAELDWLFDHALESEIAIVSVGTSNTYKHPRDDVIKALTSRGTRVMCTQITHQCNGQNRKMEFLRPGIIAPSIYVGKSSRVQDLTSSKNSRNVACAGTIRVAMSTITMVVDRIDEHQLAVDKLSTLTTHMPLCRQ